MFKFTWDEALPKNIVDDVCRLVESSESKVRKSVRELIITILENEGGISILNDREQAEKIEDIILVILEKALRKSFRGYLERRDWPGLKIEETNKGQKEAIYYDRVGVNFADTHQLQSLPGIGKRLAEEIVANRRRYGQFDSSSHLADSVDGIGKRKANEIDALVHYRKEIHDLKPHSGFIPTLKYLMEKLFWIDDSRTLLRILECTATASAARISEKWLELSYDDSTYTFEHNSPSLEILQNARYYYRMIELIDNSMSSIDLAMFHIAFPGNDHPTLKLLQALVAARSRGVNVRVLVDRDRRSDPYLSTVINKNALEYLHSQKIKVRWDTPDVLLHSKFTLIDKKTIVIGSHNWSAGSYFRHDDISIVLESKPAAKQMKKRFDKLWLESEVYSGENDG